jgi:sec-independent protein translocase protein TatA
MLMPRIGPTELIIVLVIILIIFGVGRLGEIGGAMGKGIREFRRGQSGELQADEPASVDEPKPSRRKRKEKV